MNRRHFLLTATGFSLAMTVPAIAHNGDETIPGFDEAAASGIPVLVHVTAPWCEVCQAQKPIVAKLVGNGDFAKMKKFDVDFDSQKEILKRYRVQMQSTMIIFKDGKEIDRQVGETEPSVIEAFLRKAL
ncbi:thioredoxin family protein [Rhizobium phaseoli]|uniref:thioredoxin family protein n=1 Tax=Rhizobium phaseoli TaxID=396 RepID=UPI0007EA25C8|nr:thioredoxin family protein [Rhizobium phaseoli]ANL39526.1 thioredoxin protein [Rhizobium phaseoli]ANL58515.1 thioredoxin protein [Rhizobium phaseoli]